MSQNEWNHEDENFPVGQRFSLQKGAWVLVYKDGTEEVLTRQQALNYKEQGCPDLTEQSLYDKDVIPAMLDIYY